MIKINDLPKGGMLKSIYFTRLSSVNGKLIPYGVESIKFWNLGNVEKKQSQLSELPPTVHTVCNVIFSEKINDNADSFFIPSTITNISFGRCPNLTNNQSIFKIPSTIKTLNFDLMWNNDGIELTSNDFNEGLTSLSILGYHNINNLSVGVLPSSIKELFITWKDDNPNGENSDGFFNFLLLDKRIKIKNLSIDCYCNITMESNLKLLNGSIESLNIELMTDSLIITPNSLPPSSLTQLSIIYINLPIELNIIPNSVTNLELFYYKQNKDDDDNDNNKLVLKNSIPNSIRILTLNKIFDIPDIYPPFLTELRFIEVESYSIESVFKMISILPKSLISITLPNSTKNLNLHEKCNLSKLIKINYQI